MQWHLRGLESAAGVIAEAREEAIWERSVWKEAAMDEVSSRGRAGCPWGMRSGVAIALVCGLWAVSVGGRTIAGDRARSNRFV